MSAINVQTISVAAVFVLAGAVKGVMGMGLPTVAMALLGLVMAPAEAAALIVIPSLITNLWQFLAGPHRLALLRRTWLMLLPVFVTTWVASGLIAGTGSARATGWLGAAVVAYAAFAKVRLTVAARWEVLLSPLVGAATGAVTGATGVFVIPAVPYLQALGFDKDDFVQVLGLSFTVSTVALAAGLATRGALQLTAAGASALCAVPALVGIGVGQMIRDRVDAVRFRRIFMTGLWLLGADLVGRSIL